MQPRTNIEQSRERADYVIKQFYEYQRDYAYPLSRMFNIMGEDAQARAETLRAIDQSSEPATVKYAAAKLFKLHDALSDGRDMQAQYDALLLALRDPALTVEHTSLIFGMYCNKAYIRHSSQNNLLTQTLHPNQGSAAWRRTVALLQEHCFIKLKAELAALDNPTPKLELLRLAKEEMHIFFWKEANNLFNDATGVEKYRIWINSEIENLKQEPRLAPPRME